MLLLLVVAPLLGLAGEAAAVEASWNRVFTQGEATEGSRGQPTDQRERGNITRDSGFNES